MDFHTNITSGAEIDPDKPVTVVMSVDGEVYILRMEREEFMRVFHNDGPVGAAIWELRAQIIKTFTRNDMTLFAPARHVIRTMHNLLEQNNSK